MPKKGHQDALRNFRHTIISPRSRLRQGVLREIPKVPHSTIIQPILPGSAAATADDDVSRAASRWNSTREFARNIRRTGVAIIRRRQQNPEEFP